MFVVTWEIILNLLLVVVIMIMVMIFNDWILSFFNLFIYLLCPINNTTIIESITSVSFYDLAPIDLYRLW